MVAASIVAEEAVEHAAAVPGWVFGGFAFVALMALLVVTLMIEQEPKGGTPVSTAGH